MSEKNKIDDRVDELRRAALFKDVARKRAKELGVSVQEFIQMFLFEAILRRIVISELNDKFILKGGLLLSSIFEMQSRTTMDMDALLINHPLNQDRIHNDFHKLLNYDIRDGVSFLIVDSIEIRENDRYHGIRLKLIAKFGHIRNPIHIDISTGEQSYPFEVIYPYTSLLSGDWIFVNAYTVETILSEKLETIVHQRGIKVRIKDYFDVYLMVKVKNVKIDWMLLSCALWKVCENRGSILYLREYDQVLKEIEKDFRINTLWKLFIEKYHISDECNFSDAIFVIHEVIETCLIYIEKNRNLYT